MYSGTEEKPKTYLTENMFYVIRKISTKEIVGVYNTHGEATMAVKNYYSTLNFLMNDNKFIQDEMKKQHVSQLKDYSLVLNDLDKNHSKYFTGNISFKGQPGRLLNGGISSSPDIPLNDDYFNVVVYSDPLKIDFINSKYEHDINKLRNKLNIGDNIGSLFKVYEYREDKKTNTLYNF